MPAPQGISLSTTFVNVCILLFKLIVMYCQELTGYNKQDHKEHKVTRAEEVAHGENDAFKLCVINAKNISEVAAISGYVIREHVITTRDGYLLVVHKLENPRLSPSTKCLTNKIVYFHHGLMTSSELFLLGSTKEKTLPYLLADLGYDVWLGNNRGNKYSRKHLKLSVSDPTFWDFSLDEFSYFDIPDTITYIKNNYPSSQDVKITYIGFSQGCSQLFASLSLNPALNSSIKLFVGLSPAIIPQNLNHPLFKLIVRQTASDNAFLYSLFGKRAILPSVSFWSTILGPRLYERVVDKSLSLLFGWDCKNISQFQREIGYPHMFSNSSVKSLVHWFQIIGAKRFQMFNETGDFGLTRLSSLSRTSQKKSHLVAPFPIADHLNVPMLLFYGDSDILVDINKTKSLIVDNNDNMREKLEVILCPEYEHMDTLWGNDVYEDVFVKVIERLEQDNNDKMSNGMQRYDTNETLVK
ncbi:uncharacterized protein SPAPADRAFT_138466 [Spathaspora passalidarum NRRL Y-27907]|uniref:Partial AB-hydrolase lipase domain-containing protein n=1 Tax=Spathaspora passalidarum (strain NRRL Y-27907 / 11-Y1) TaxID=619300 RepID=G3ANZ1_SPAPN|nr:uncharacterized protein SPAPADRAFT_138466 [Spathaspora passalidarum NRRL Y-27907]EGW32616.1 hypothetical protein SPAPADRAFT_138466 [Spathaspora passalidarum NRRL Y-27907]